ncbi:hypothetical protein SAMN05421678_12456 [Actinopolymorpha cephalotaxi]|uniref:Uncharacterized protein n=1 Tax=Actinopolymorpha cephalotaxi TaxID=504797 RepID=A0A1I3BIA0_9ACTN|nr:hypothetical protein [Actinopolymorpha cephalotaxi]NYH86406.1 hypothetical protein [Actinopolymorpha cephalotaxi]SFH62044.1 hypothetical protein SAMN05421678_12456 [Actinopolymorpha cephalotaxi]
MNVWGDLALVVLALLAVVAVGSWVPTLHDRVEQLPWWLVAFVPAGLLGLAGLFASGVAGDPSHEIQVLAVVLSVAVAISGGEPVTHAILRGAGESGIPDITRPVAPAPPAGEGPDGGTPGGPGTTPGAQATPGRPDGGALAGTGARPSSPGSDPLSGVAAERGLSGSGGLPAGVPGAARSITGTETPRRPGRVRTGRPVLRGGAWIGVLERAAIASCLLVGYGEGVAVVLAVKGLGRYPDLRASGAAERFIIGTFVSLLWAGGAAGIGLLLRGSVR